MYINVWILSALGSVGVEVWDKWYSLKGLKYYSDISRSASRFKRVLNLQHPKVWLELNIDPWISHGERPKDTHDIAEVVMKLLNNQRHETCWLCFPMKRKNHLAFPTWCCPLQKVQKPYHSCFQVWVGPGTPMPRVPKHWLPRGFATSPPAQKPGYW